MVGSSGLTNPTPLVLTEVLRRYGVGSRELSPEAPWPPSALSRGGIQGSWTNDKWFQGSAHPLVLPKPERAWSILVILSQLKIRKLG